MVMGGWRVGDAELLMCGRGFRVEKGARRPGGDEGTGDEGTGAGGFDGYMYLQPTWTACSRPAGCDLAIADVVGPVLPRTGFRVLQCVPMSTVGGAPARGQTKPFPSFACTREYARSMIREGTKYLIYQQ
jgi:hypothetical protein